jgi:hypothetical protein
MHHHLKLETKVEENYVVADVALRVLSCPDSYSISYSASYCAFGSNFLSTTRFGYSFLVSRPVVMFVVSLQTVVVFVILISVR